jgi:hypothetical protein
MGRLDTIDSRLEVADQHTRIIGSLALESAVGASDRNSDAWRIIGNYAGGFVFFYARI